MGPPAMESVTPPNAGKPASGGALAPGMFGYAAAQQQQQKGGLQGAGGIAATGSHASLSMYATGPPTPTSLGAPALGFGGAPGVAGAASS